MNGRAHHRGLTLLEMLIALVILSSIMGGVGLFWSQARGWEEDNAAHREVLRVERVLRVLREQWGARRALSPEGEGDAGGDGVFVSADAIEFTSARGVLMPGWGLVRARYVIERDGFGGYRLVYQEARILDPREPSNPGTAAVDPRGRPIGGRAVLLEGLTGLRVERWGTLDGAPSEGGGVGETDEEGAERGEDDEVASGFVLKDDVVDRWRVFDRPIAFPLGAVRLVGEMGEEVFGCVLVVAPLR